MKLERVSNSSFILSWQFFRLHYQQLNGCDAAKYMNCYWVCVYMYELYCSYCTVLSLEHYLLLAFFFSPSHSFRKRRSSNCLACVHQNRRKKKSFLFFSLLVEIQTNVSNWLNFFFFLLSVLEKVSKTNDCEPNKIEF